MTEIPPIQIPADATCQEASHPMIDLNQKCPVCQLTFQERIDQGKKG